MPALERAIALKQMDEVAVLIAQELDFDVAGATKILFQENVGDPECLPGFAARLLQGIIELTWGLGNTHPPAAAAQGRLDDHRVTELTGQNTGFGVALHRGVTARKHGSAGALRDPPRRHLVAQLFQHSHARSNEDQPRFPASTSEPRVLRQKPVAGMDRINFMLDSQGHDAGNVQVSPDRLTRLADAIGLVRFEPVQGEAILLRVNRHRADAQLVRRAENTNGDLAAVGGQQFAKGP